MNTEKERRSRRQRILDHLKTTDPHWHYPAKIAQDLELDEGVVRRDLEGFVNKGQVRKEFAQGNSNITLFLLTETGLKKAEGEPWTS